MRGSRKLDKSPSGRSAVEDGSSPTAPAFTVAIYSLAFCSGMAALVYELTWARMLALTFGSTTLATSAVIGAFMGGMGIGARSYDLIYKRLRRPLLIYAGLELGIALTTAILTRTFYSLPEIFADISGPVPPGASLALFRFVAVFILLLLPSALMGATFPALCTAMIRSAAGVDRHLGWIYGINTVGGAGGVLLAGLILIERLGLSATVNVANAINIAVGLAALLLASRELGRGDATSIVAKESVIRTTLPRWLTGMVLFVAGCTTLSYEILWFRALRYIVGNSTYALTIVLMIFLVGLGLGSLLLHRIVRRGSPERDLGLCQCIVAVLALGAVALEAFLLWSPELRDYISIYSHTVRGHPWWWRLLIDGGVATLVMLPATLAMGLAFPLASRLYLGDVKSLGKRVGGAYLLSNLGSIAGAMLGAVILLPVFGTIGGTKVSAVVNLALGILLILWVRQRVARGMIFALVAGVAVATMAVVLPRALTLRGESIYQAEADQVFVEEGDLATVQVLAEPGKPAAKVMTIDGHKIGWSDAFRGTPFYRKQILLSHLPMVLDTRIRHTLNIGLGSATTLATLASYPEVETLDCVEISGAVARASKYFEASAVLEDPRVSLVVEDAIHYLLRSDKKYDAIISDGKEDPFFAGNATLLCREFYQHAMDDLAEDGIFVQWVTLGTLAFDFRVILRTVCDVFPYVEVFYVPQESAFMVGSKRPLSGRPQLSQARSAQLPTQRELRYHFFDHPVALMSHHVAGKQQLLHAIGDAPISTWDHLLLDFSPYKAAAKEWGSARLENLSLLIEAENTPLESSAGTFDPGQTPYKESVSLVRKAWAAHFEGRVGEAIAVVEQAVAINPEDSAAKAILVAMRRSAKGVQNRKSGR